MYKYHRRSFEKAEYVKTQPDEERYDLEVDGDVEEYIEDRRREFYAEWMEYLTRDNED